MMENAANVVTAPATNVHAPTHLYNAAPKRKVFNSRIY